MTDALQGQWTLDPTHSEAGFTVRHAGVSKVRGKFDDVKANVVHHGSTATVEAVLDAATFNSGNADRDAHVRSADFLDVEKYPELTFKGEFDGKSTLAGDLTIHGVTKPVELDVEVFGEAVDPFGNRRLGVEANTVINRKDFGLTWNAPLQVGAGVLVSDKVNITLDLSFIAS